jgi:uncharacterized protein (UPF0305 family)
VWLWLCVAGCRGGFGVSRRGSCYRKAAHEGQRRNVVSLCVLCMGERELGCGRAL